MADPVRATPVERINVSKFSMYARACRQEQLVSSKAANAETFIHSHNDARPKPTARNVPRLVCDVLMGSHEFK